jgi:hypothetical protein
MKGDQADLAVAENLFATAFFISCQKTVMKGVTNIISQSVQFREVTRIRGCRAANPVIASSRQTAATAQIIITGFVKIPSLNRVCLCEIGRANV